MMLNHLILGQSLLKAPLTMRPNRAAKRSPNRIAVWLKHELAALFVPFKRNQAS